jgi:Domain of unknown function (DUF4833)
VSRRLIGFLLLVGAASPAASGTEACGPLFTVERNLNANVVVYEAVHGTDGRLDRKKPVRVYWLMKAEDGRALGLNFFERVRAYGVEVTGKPEEDTFSLKMRAFPGRSLLLREHGGCAEVVTEIDGKSAVLARVFVSATKGLFPSVAFVDVFGTDPESGLRVKERVDTGGRTR